MKLPQIALLLLVLIGLLVSANAIAITDKVDGYIEMLDQMTVPEHVEDLNEQVRELRRSYEHFEQFVSLTVSHEDLMDIRSSLSDLTGAVEADDRAAFLQAKSRLRDALWHLRRLSSFDIYSIL